ncbi:MAG: enoyl-CoA hydratase/isomerase family protein [Firmicutes bacterium]|nr:enoyl-CoA hydratase/isomerase family protein [Bacillota bacterium]
MSYRDKKYNTMLVTVEDDIAIIQFNRPEALNAVNEEMSYERLEIFAGVAQDPEVKVVIITGGEKVYCAGGDLVSFSKFGVVEARAFADRVVANQKLLADMPKPTIAAVAGYAFGGGMENVLMCDLRIAADNAKFALPEINVGIFPGGGGTQRLVQNISICKAKEMIFFGEPIDAQTALALGIINKVVPLAELMDTAKAWAKKLAKKPPIALRMAKMAINAAWSCDIDTGLKLESDAWAMVYGTEDQKEGMRAFIEKRKPNFKGR